MAKKHMTDLECKSTISVAPLSKTPEYRAWAQMRYRCENPNHREYRYYGGRGIAVCAEWSEFEGFLRDMGPRPSREHSLERIDSAHGYGPENCKWATLAEQANNKRRNRRLTWRGETLTMAQWSERTGIPSHTIATRLDRAGWSVDKALSTPSRRMSAQLSDDQIRELRELRDAGWAIADLQTRYGCSRRTVFKYLRAA